MKKITLILFIVLNFIRPAYAQNWLNLNKKNGLSDNYVKKILIYGRELWIGTPSGVSVYDLDRKKWTHYSKKNVLPDNFVNDILIDENYIWIATVKGLAQFNKTRKKWTTFTKKNGLSDDHITCIYSDKENYWFGTGYWGVSVFSKRTGSWSVYTSIDGLAGNKVNYINGIGDEIWFGTKDGITQLKYYEFIWKIFTSANTEFGLSRNSVISLVVDGDDVWCGTEGEGICKFNTYNEKWVQYNTGNKLLDDFILSMVKDGENIWAGTFGGVSLYNKYANTWQNFGERKELPEPSITSIAVDGDYIWFGTAGGGITRYKKEKPQIDINLTRSGYAQKNLIKLYGTIYDYDGIRNVNISFRRRNENAWYDKGIRILKNNNTVNDLFAQWETGGLDDGEYIVKIDVFDSKGKFNSAETVFRIDTIKPILYLDEYYTYNKFVNAGEVNITGTYFEDNLAKIILSPGERNVSIDKLLKTFSVPITLKNGINAFKLEAVDIAGQNTVIPFKIIKDTVSPVIRVLNKKTQVSEAFYPLRGEYKEENIDTISILPSGTTADIDLKNQTFSKTVKLESGKNTITCIAKDKAGNKTSAKINLIYTPNQDPVIFENYSDFTREKIMVLKGKVSARDISSVSAELNKMSIPVKVDPKSKRLTVKLNLEEGKNYLSLNIIGKENKNYLMVKEIVRDTVVPVIKFTKFPQYIKDRNTVINGTYSDENLDKIYLPDTKGSEVKIIPANQSFSMSLTVINNITPLKFIVSDKAGNRSEYNTNIIFDNITPKFSKLTYPRYTNKKEAEISGEFIEENPQKIEIDPGEIIELSAGRFKGIAYIREEENEIKLKLYDQSSLTAVSNFTINHDQEKPDFNIQEIPDITDSSAVKVSGEIKSDDVVKITAEPGNKELDIKDNSFSGILKLQNGMNEIKIEVFDHAGNSSQYKKEVFCNAETASEPPKGLITLSKTEYQKLKENRTGSFEREPVKRIEYKRIKLPKSISLVLAPYSVSRGDSLWKLSKSYYGSSDYADYVQKFNELIEPSSINSREELFVPTIQLINQISEAENRDYSKILSLITLIRYNYGYFPDMRRFNKYLRTLLNNYGLDYSRIFSNYNNTVYIINKKNLLILSRGRADINSIKGIKNGVELNGLDVLMVENHKNRITCNILKNYSFRK
ncbi:MAG: hypothetical protein KKH98_09075 [Spirochaetes bacterium]|nr:hypothetical protein [Spirochaetota bacterium]